MRSCGPRIHGNKCIAGAFLDWRNLYLLGPVPRFVVEHLPNEACYLGVAGPCAGAILAVASRQRWATSAA